MLNVRATGETMIFRKDFQGAAGARAAYSTTIGKKEQDGSYTNGWIDVRFKNGVDLPNKTKINIKNGFLTFWMNKENRPQWQLMILEFEETERADNGLPVGFTSLENEDFVPF